jgi:hypothetical protein
MEWYWIVLIVIASIAVGAIGLFWWIFGGKGGGWKA